MPIVEYHAGKPKTQWHSTRRAKQIRDALRTALGGRCARCKGSKADILTFDHINPVGWTASAHSWHARMLEYQRAHAEGNLQLLCIRCHGKKSAADQATLDELKTDRQDPF